MSSANFSFACVPTDRTRPVMDGRVDVNNIQFDWITGEPEEIFRRALQEKSFDVTELSMSSHILTTARGDSAYTGIPVFLSRAFRHSSIFIRTDRGIARPKDLVGRRIGLPEYQQTAALWVRGILWETYGVSPEDVTWVVGSQEQPGGTERVSVILPPRIHVERIGPEDTLNAMLAAGDIDAIVTPRPPSCFVNKSAPVDRLFPNYRDAEVGYYGDTGYFPIMHCLTVRKDVAEANPWLPLALLKAFSRAKDLAVRELSMLNVARVTLPWASEHLRTTIASMGKNFWSYGFAANRDELAAMLRFAVKDGLISRTFQPESLFHPSTLEFSEPLGDA